MTTWATRIADLTAGRSLGELRRRIDLLEEDVAEDAQIVRLTDRVLGDLERTVGTLCDRVLTERGS